MRLTADSSYFKVINGLLISSDGTLISCLSKDTHIHIPNPVTQIGGHAFFWCEALQNINIPSSVTQIGNYAFSKCSSLQDINIPNSVTYIGINPFLSCPRLRLTADSSYFKVINGLLISSDGTLISCLSKDTHIHIPNSITQIGDSAFSWCKVQQSIYIPNSVTQIGDYAFGDCSSLQNINIPNSITQIGDDAFSWCTALQTIHIPKGSMEKFMQLLPEEFHDKLVEI